MTNFSTPVDPLNGNTPLNSSSNSPILVSGISELGAVYGLYADSNSQTNRGFIYKLGGFTTIDSP
jgi:hypothetical protein